MKIGIDLGGTKVEAVLLDNEGNVKEKIRVPTPADDYEKIIASIAELVNQLESAAGMTSLPVGIGTPGAVSAKTGRIKNSNSAQLNGRSVREDLSLLLNRSVSIANDADCFTLSEAVDGAATGANLVFGVILGTGVGGGICVDRRLIKGANSITGEWGHNQLEVQEVTNAAGLTDRRDCYCGKQNCVETWLSGPGFQQSYLDKTGLELPASEIVELYRSSNNEQAQEVIEVYCRLLAFALSVVVNILDPEVIVLGGGMSNIEEIYEWVPGFLASHVFSDQISTRLVKARWGDSSGVRGAAWLN